MDTLDIARQCAEVAVDKKLEDVLLLDVRDRTPLADYFLVATARNRRQLKAAAQAMAGASPKTPRRYKRVEGHGGGRWVLLDLGDVVIHLFDAEARAFYDLESLWADAPRLALSKPAAKAERAAKE